MKCLREGEVCTFFECVILVWSLRGVNIGGERGFGLGNLDNCENVTCVEVGLVLTFLICFFIYKKAITLLRKEQIRSNGDRGVVTRNRGLFYPLNKWYTNSFRKYI